VFDASEERAVLQRLEGRSAASIHRDDLAVEDGLADFKAWSCGRDGGVHARQVLSVAGLDGHLVRVPDEEGPVAVQLQFI
jgi:hypothetical protein